MEDRIPYVGLDVHKDTMAVALADEGERGEVRAHGIIAHTASALSKLAAKLAHGRRELRFCYEAGPCGYGIQRQLSEAGHECVVVAPSLEHVPFASAHGKCSRLLFYRASLSDQMIPSDRMML